MLKSICSLLINLVIAMSPRKPILSKEEKNKLVRMSFDVSEDLRNNFKAKLAKQGKTAREAIVEFMKEYIKK